MCLSQKEHGLWEKPGEGPIVVGYWGLRRECRYSHLKKENGARAARPCKSGETFRLAPGSARYHRKLCELWVAWCGPAAAAAPGNLWVKHTLRPHPRPAEWNPRMGEPSNLV